MLEADAEAETIMVCVNCGIAEAEGDDIKLEECDGCQCQSVRYCSDKCREDHREEHEEECKNRKAWLHGRKLFTQPDETHLGECPICFLPLQIDRQKSQFQTCCSNFICHGCAHSQMTNGNNNCPFCREPSADDEEERTKRLMKRVKAMIRLR